MSENLNIAAPALEAATAAEFAEWQNLVTELGPKKDREALLRRKIFGTYFTNPREGTNRIPLENGKSLCATRVVNRKLIIEVYEAKLKELRALGVPKDIVVAEPKLVIGTYKKMSEPLQAAFDVCLQVSDGMPQMIIDQPKRATK